MEYPDKVVVFKVGNDEFAADIMQIERILNYTKCSMIPQAPSFVEGVIDYEQRIIPVINLNRRLGLTENGVYEDSRIIVTKNNEERLGLLVDYVEQVLSINKDNIDLPPEAIKGSDNNYVQGIIRFDNKIIILLNLNRLLTNEEIIELNSLC